MPALRLAALRGLIDDPGVSGRAAFSHAGAFDPAWLGFGALRVLNRLRLAPGAALPQARRANMALLTFVQAGRYRAQSQAGDSGEIATGGWVALSAGAGVDLFERNADADRPLDLLQAWVQPARSNGQPVQSTCAAVAHGPVVGGDAAPLAWSAEARASRVLVAPGGAWSAAASPGRALWVEVLGGELFSGGEALRAGDGLGLRDEPAVALVSSFGGDLLVFDLPA